MGQLGARDLAAVLEFTLEVQTVERVDDLRVGLLSALRRLVPCEFIGYNEIDLLHDRALGIIDPSAGVFEAIDRQFLAVIHQHPLVARQQQGDLTPRALSDFLTARRFHGLELYNDFYKLIDAEDQLAFGLPGEVMVAFALCRSTRGFSDRDREVLELVRPHLSEAYRRARERERIAALVEAIESDLEARQTGMLQVDARGQVAHAAGAAQELLDAYFDLRADDGDALPAWLLARIGGNNGHAANGHAEREVTVAGPRGHLQIEWLAEVDGWRTLALRERRGQPPSLDGLRSLGLTSRQAQVMRLLACGKSNRQIAAELQIAQGTVAKHLEHIYSQLGVATRGEALARVYA